jgi:hypothetical protein
MLQVGHLDADAQELVGNKATAAAADELRGLLECSKAVNSRKGCTPEQQELYNSLPQVGPWVQTLLIFMLCLT